MKIFIGVFLIYILMILIGAFLTYQANKDDYDMTIKRAFGISLMWVSVIVGGIAAFIIIIENFLK